MVNSMKPQGYRRKEDMLDAQSAQALHEQEIIDSVSETLESSTTPIVLEEHNVRERSFFSTVVSCTPYVIMAMGVYMIWTRTRKLFKPTNDDPVLFFCPVTLSKVDEACLADSPRPIDSKDKP